MTVQPASNEFSEHQLSLLSASPMPSPPELSLSPLNEVTTSTQSSTGLAILLLDAENLRLDINTEKFLADISP
ncbi:MAG: hypothetical protein Fur006_13740 [Coleofasciculaceae cyanobacterium]